MKTAKDARYLINRKRLKRPTNVVRKASRGIVDARSILNSKFGQKSRLIASNSSAGSFPLQRSSFVLNKRSAPTSSQASAQEKRIKIAQDGNIVITAKSKDTQVKTVPRPVPRWTPSDVDTTEVEHLGIDDVLDMDSLPSAVVTHETLPIYSKNLVEDIVDMQNTMIADQVSTMQQQSVCVCVSNLHSSVSKQDVIELFGDIGLIKRAEMKQPGIALVEYFDPKDAVRACELYHQRLLDGKPMMCQVQSQTTPKRPLLSQRLGERVEAQPLVNSRSIHNPRNVRFTVKLT